MIARVVLVLVGWTLAACGEGTRLAGDECDPGALACRDNVVVRCEPDGHGWSVVTECTGSLVCRDGACVPGPTPGCGDGGCGPGETCASCPADCVCGEGWTCADGTCRLEPWPLCWDGICSEAETCASCPDDCPCGAGMACRSGTCVLDPACGDGSCADAENCLTCPVDCGCGAGALCRDGRCVDTRAPVRVAILRSEATEFPGRFLWRDLARAWPRFGDIPVQVDLSSLAHAEITHADLVAAGPDVLVVSDPVMVAAYTESELMALQQYLRECHGILGFHETVEWMPSLSRILGVLKVIRATPTDFRFCGVFRHVTPGHPMLYGLADPFDPYPPIPSDPGAGGFAAARVTLSDWRITADGEVVVVALSTDCEEVDGVYGTAGIVAWTGGWLGCGRAAYITAGIDSSNEGRGTSETAYRLLHNAVFWAADRAPE